MFDRASAASATTWLAAEKSVYVGRQRVTVLGIPGGAARELYVYTTRIPEEFVAKLERPSQRSDCDGVAICHHSISLKGNRELVRAAAGPKCANNPCGPKCATSHPVTLPSTSVCNADAFRPPHPSCILLGCLWRKTNTHVIRKPGNSMTCHVGQVVARASDKGILQEPLRHVNRPSPQSSWIFPTPQSFPKCSATWSLAEVSLRMIISILRVCSAHLFNTYPPYTEHVRRWSWARPPKCRCCAGPFRTPNTDSGSYYDVTTLRRCLCLSKT